ncbi:MAG: hypothetical protein JSS90_12205 [Bacteroidetes bacterium]|nr:hypothetical protein [Bacteroidota bacterium]
MSLFLILKRVPKYFGTLFKGLTCVLLFVVSCFYANSQNYSPKENKYQFGFEIASTLVPKPQTTREFGNAKLLTRNTWGFEAGVSLKYVLNRNLNLLSGIYWGILPYSWGFDFKQGESSSLQGNSFSDRGAIYDINYWYFPFNLEQKLWSNKKYKINVLAGANVRYYSNGQTQIGYDYGYLDTLRSYDSFFLMVLDVNVPYKLRLNYQLGASSDIKLKDFDDIKISLLYNFSFAKIVKGDYGFFMDTPEYTFGTYSMTGSYLTLKLGYVLTGGRKIKRELEQEQ